MKVRFEVDEDISVLKNEDLGCDYYFDSYLEVYAIDEDIEVLLFSTTMHSTILSQFSRLLISLHQTDDKQDLDPFGNANIISLEKKGSNLIVTNFSEFYKQNEWIHTFDLFNFTSAYTTALKQYLDSLVEVKSDIVEYKLFIFLKEELETLQTIIK